MDLRDYASKDLASYSFFVILCLNVYTSSDGISVVIETGGHPGVVKSVNASMGTVS